jgi:hypothetical protein
MRRMLRMAGMTFSVNLRIEPAVLIRRVLHSENGTVRFVQRVLSLDHIPIPRFRLRLDIPSVMVLDSVFELIFGVGLDHNNHNNHKLKQSAKDSHNSLDGGPPPVPRGRSRPPTLPAPIHSRVLDCS